MAYSNSGQNYDSYDNKKEHHMGKKMSQHKRGNNIIRILMYLDLNDSQKVEV
jgi:hypothetical protein